MYVREISRSGNFEITVYRKTKVLSNPQFGTRSKTNPVRCGRSIKFDCSQLGDIDLLYKLKLKVIHTAALRDLRKVCDQLDLCFLSMILQLFFTVGHTKFFV